MPLVNKFFSERKTIFLDEIESPYLAMFKRSHWSDTPLLKLKIL